MTAELGENASDMPTDRCCTAFWVRYSMTEWKINRDMGLLCSVYGYILFGRGRSEFGVDILEWELWSQKNLRTPRPWPVTHILCRPVEI